jgi:hypothetical protein
MFKKNEDGAALVLVFLLLLIGTILFSFNIVWSDRNYSTEVLLAGEE